MNADRLAGQIVDGLAGCVRHLEAAELALVDLRAAGADVDAGLDAVVSARLELGRAVLACIGSIDLGGRA